MYNSKGDYMINEDIVHLQHAHVTQYSGQNGCTNWKVRKNITSEDLAELPGDLTEDEVFKVLEFARNFELIAFNEGIKFGKKQAWSLYDPLVNRLKDDLKLALEANERLATKLEKFILSEE
jgi:hypothetical protein